MILDLLLVCIALVIPITIGWHLLGFFPDTHTTYLERFGFSLGLGLGLITALEVLFLYFGIKLSMWVFLIFGASIFSMGIFSQRKPSITGQYAHEPLSFISKFALFILFFQFMYSFVQTFNYPIFVDDAVSLWGFKAKLIFYANQSGGTLKTIAEQNHITLNGHYPLFLPLAEGYINIFIGKWHDLYPKVLSSLFYVFLLMAFYSALRRFTGKNNSILVTFFMGTLTFVTGQMTWAIADIPFAYHYFLSFILLCYWIRSENNQYLYLSAIFSVLTFWTKIEGYPSVLILWFILGFSFFMNKKKDFKKFRIPLVVNFFIIALPAILLISYQLSTGVKDLTLSFHSFSLEKFVLGIQRFPYVLKSFSYELFGSLNYFNLMGYLFVAAFLYNIKKSLTDRYIYTLLVIVLNCALYVSVFMLTNLEVGYHMTTAQDRMIIHFLPFLFLYVAMVFSDGQSQTSQFHQRQKHLEIPSPQASES